MAPDAPTGLLIWALYIAPDLVSDMKLFLGEDMVITASSGSMTRAQWFEALAKEVAKKKLEYDTYLDQRWNPLFLPYGTPPNVDYVLNPIGIPCRFWGDSPMWYDPELITFYNYNRTTGIWQALVEEQVKAKITEYLLPYAKSSQSFLPSNKMVDGIVKTLKNLSLREETKCSESPVHLGNTMLFLSTRKESAFSPAYYSRNRVAIHYSKKDTGTTKFTAFLKCAIDKDDIDLLQHWCGMVILNRNPFHKILLLMGAAGSGKSTFFNIVERILGHENIATLVVDRLEDRFELGEFFGKSLLVAKDVSSDFLGSKKVHMLKSLSGDKHIKAEIKFSNKRILLGGPFNIGLTSNADLNIKLQGDVDAWKRRLLVVKFDPAAILASTGGRMFTPDPKLEDKLIENEGSGILNWMLRGAQSILAAEASRKSFPLTGIQTARINSLLETSDAIDSFVRSQVKPAAGKSVTTEDLYIAYEAYSGGLGIYPANKNEFAKRLPPLMFAYYKSTQGILSPARLRGYNNVQLNSKK